MIQKHFAIKKIQYTINVCYSDYYAETCESWNIVSGLICYYAN